MKKDEIIGPGTVHKIEGSTYKVIIDKEVSLINNVQYVSVNRQTGQITLYGDNAHNANAEILAVLPEGTTIMKKSNLK